MQNWNNSDDLANEYATDLKALKSLYNDYKTKRDNCLKLERECQEQGDWDAAQTYREEYQQHLTNAKEIGSIISSSEYSIKWLRTGAEPKTVASVTQLSYISIHAPYKGCNTTIRFCRRTSTNFNPCTL